MFCSVVANIVVSYAIAFLEALTGLTFTQGESLDPSSIFDCVMLVISTAIIPAICEEFALRCCSLQLLRKYGKGFGVLTVSIVFGLLHGNVIQFLYAFIVGAILAYVTVKTDSIVPAVLIHGLSNGMSVVQSIVAYAYGENSSDSVVVILYAFWGIVGIASLIVLATKGAFKTEPKPKDDVLTFGQKISAFLFPWMIVPFLILIGITITTIQK
jgi:hypothetical protein